MTQSLPARCEAGAHTAGPWLRVDTADYAEIHAAFRPSSQAIALVGKSQDADLIANAPLLLNVVQRFVSALDGEGKSPDYYRLAADARAAIARATGQSEATHG